MNMDATTNLGINHIQVIVRAMHEVAQLDGVHDAEAVMLREFYGAVQQDTGALTSFQELSRGTFDLDEARRILDTPERKAALLRSCLLLAYADGRYSTAEREMIRNFADALGVPAHATLALEESVADQLMQNIARISNIDALREVAARTKPS
ncbi:MAG: Tellurite resistance protein TerB [Panacagrimonas sp.]|jgi:tellurite resistance protein|nr:TerB family tellurite resistance protein [Panacagrimonas sp.]MCC2656536.1 Tellurite resistance protein TerB [Panacagrimonas sp.]